MSKKQEYKLPFKQPGSTKVWKVIELNKKGEDKPIKFSIQEVPEYMYEDVIEHMCTYFIRDEPMCKTFNGINDPDFVEDFRQVWRQCMQHGLSVSAIVEDPNGGKPILAAVNVLLLALKGEDLDLSTLKSKNSKTLADTFAAICKKGNVFEKYGTDKYISAFGLSVHPSYRGAGLGGHLLNARVDIGREYNISVTSTGFTSVAAQKLAAKCDFELLYEEKFADLLDEDGNEIFPGIESPSMKVMARRLD